MTTRRGQKLCNSKPTPPPPAFCVLFMNPPMILFKAVSENKGAPCTRCAYFRCRVHDFRRCAPGVCIFLSYLSLLHIRRVHGKMPGCTVLGEVHPVGAQNKTLISDTVICKGCVPRLCVFFERGGGGEGGAKRFGPAIFPCLQREGAQKDLDQRCSHFAAFLSNLTLIFSSSS